jgi:hypothetical protein
MFFGVPKEVGKEVGGSSGCHDQQETYFRYSAGPIRESAKTCAGVSARGDQQAKLESREKMETRASTSLHV